VKVLIANMRSDLFRGTETFSRDLAIGLERRGHSVVVYSDGTLNEARSMQTENVRVCHDLARLPFRPDVIHGHCGGLTMAAVAAHADVPALFFSHGAVRSLPIPRHPRIYRYVAMSSTMALRLVVESAIDEAATDVVTNTIDLKRFSEVRSPPSRPVRALFYSSAHVQGNAAVAVARAAAGAAGLTFDCAGHSFGVPLDRPEKTLLEYDIVFASGKSALEAIACGAAVITIGLTSCGQLVRPDNFDRMRAANLSVSVNTVLPSMAEVHREIDRCTPEDAAAVTRRVRQEADGELMITQMEDIYAKVLKAHAEAVHDPSAEHRALASYCRALVPLFTLHDEMMMTATLKPLKAASAGLLASAKLSALMNAAQPRAKE